MKSLEEFIKEELISEMGPKTAALTRGANAAASKIDDKDKMGRSSGLDLIALNYSFNQRFPNLLLEFKEKNSALWIPLDVKDIDVIRLDRTLLVFKANVKCYNQEWRSGYIEYNFKKKTFYEIKYYRSGTIRHLFHLEPLRQNYNLVAQVLAFLNEYLDAADEYASKA